MKRFLSLAAALSTIAVSVQAAPKPLSGGIPISFSLPKPAVVTLVLEDSQGRRVRNLVSEQRFGSGKQRVMWDGRDEDGKAVAPSKYFMRGLTHEGIRPRFEFAVNTEGNPPWHTLDRSGAWMADHSPPQATLFLPRGASPYGGGVPQILVASQVAEVGHPLVWLDLDGKKLYGGDRIEGWSGGVALTRDIGPKALTDPYAYTLIVSGGAMRAFALKRDGSTAPVGERIELGIPNMTGEQERESGFSIAAYNGQLLISDPPHNRVFFLDIASGKQIGVAPIQAPTALAFDANGRLYVATGHSLRRYSELENINWQDNNWWNSNDETLIFNGLQAPRSMTVGADGTLYVCDMGERHQVLCYDTNGQFLRAIGKAGGLQIGRYDEERMQMPSGVALDERGQLWVGEADYVPKRLSLWKSDGTFVRAFYGPPRYGGGGTLDPSDKTRYFYASYANGTVEFKLDWARGSFKPAFIVWRPGLLPIDVMPHGASPDTPIEVHGQRYLTSAWTPGLRYNEDIRFGIWKIGADEIARPVMLFGNGDWFEHGVHGFPLRYRQQIRALWKGRDRNRVLWLWSDRNGDQFVQPDEVQWREMPSVHYPAHLQPDFSLLLSHGQKIPAPAFDERGTPLYDLSKMAPIPGVQPGDAPLQYGKQLLMVSENEEGRRIYGSEIGGAKAWTLRSFQDPLPGQLVQPTRLLGWPVAPKSGEAGPLIAINGEKGAIFLVTMDGLFVATLGADERLSPLLRAAKATRGMPIENVSFAGEHFAPTMTQTSDGEIYLAAGHEFSALFRLDGLEDVRRQKFGSIRVSASQIARAIAPVVNASGGVKTVRVPFGARQMQAATIAEGITASAWIEGEHLKVLYRTGDWNTLANGGNDRRFLFKTGGALDIMLRTDAKAGRNPAVVAGDVRLLVTRLGDKTVAMLYRAVVPGTPEKDRVAFTSPVGRVVFDRVEDVSDRVQLVSSGADFTVAVPLSVLGWKPIAGGQTLGDFGVLKGNGVQTTRRLYWSNKNTDIVSDIPSEARLQPGNWGLWTFAP